MQIDSHRTDNCSNKLATWKLFCAPPLIYFLEKALSEKDKRFYALISPTQEILFGSLAGALEQEHLRFAISQKYSYNIVKRYV